MTLSAGFRLGQYEIVAPIGVGGMGEVYRATDTRLKRDVALKVLPAAFTQNEERLARLEREAQLLAQLHHPNIASIFGIEESDAVRALVMELVEGPTLAERLESGPFPLDEALLVSRQIAEALEAAHEKGIIHRDLKPQNVKASIEGRVKVLDFGLAKAMAPEGAAGEGSGSQLAHSPTLTIGATVQGMILGTAGYMAPEQAKGFAVDKRVDIWAFGVVLYEMLAGGTLFAGDSVGDTLAAVIRAEIDLGKLPPETPPPIRRLLRRCLERNPKNRLHDIADARLVIDDALAGRGDEPVTGTAVGGAESAKRRPAWLLPAVALVAIALGFAAGRFGRQPSADEASAAAFVAQALPSGLSVANSDLLDLAISPDGRRQAVVVETAPGETQILLRDLSDPAPRRIPGTENGRTPFFSPDGENLGFFADTEIRRISVRGGGSSLRVASGTSGVFASRGATWSRDGFIYFPKTTGSPLSRVSENGGEVEEVTQLLVERQERTHRWPTALPDGSAVLFTSDTVVSTEYYDDARIEAVRPATGERKVLIEGSSMARFLPPDRLVFARGGMLFAVPFDPVALAVSGRPVALGQQVLTQIASGAAEFALAENGTLLWLPGEGLEANREVVWIHPGGEEEAIAGLAPGSYTQVALSPDGRRAVLGVSAASELGLSVVDLERLAVSRLTFETMAMNPVWTPDGKRVAYHALAAGQTMPGIFWKNADGSGGAERLLSSQEAWSPSDFSPDGRQILFVRRGSGGDALGTTWIAPVDRSAEPRSLELAPGSSSIQAEVSPDGRWVAYVSMESDSLNVYLRPFPEGEGKWQVTTGGGGSEPHWSARGDAIYYRYGGSIFRVSFDATGGVRFGAPERIGATVFSGTLPTGYAVADEGRILTFRYVGGLAAIQEVDLALGWGEKVARLTAGKR